jgi:hypothetical protein
MSALSIYQFVRQRRAATGIVLFVALALTLLGGWMLWPHAFFRAYWLALMFWTQLSIGALIVLLIQYLSGGQWGRAGAPILRAIMAGFFLLIPLFLPPLFALPHLFSWTAIRAGISSEVLVNKQPWLDQPFFIVRTLFYLAAFALIMFVWRRKGVRTEEWYEKWSGPVLVFAIVLISFAPADWMMSLQPTFYSSLYPFIYFSGAMVSTFAAVTATVCWLQLREIWPVRPDLLLAYGKLLFAAVLFWGYIMFSQFIIIWTGNLPDEAEWYVIRSGHGWLPVTILVIALHFAVPFCLLLSHRLKRNPGKLLRICLLLFLMHLVEVFWMMRPTPGEGIFVTPFDFVLPLLLGACWLWYVIGCADVPAILTAPLEDSHE